MIKKIILFAFLFCLASLPLLVWGQITTSGGGGGAPAGTTNVLPMVAGTPASSSAGSVTSLAITPPSAIVNGNALWIFIAVKGAASETWTPAAGWAQVGSTLQSNVTSQVVTAKFCKIAASESGNYTFSWNNASTGGVQAVALQVAGSTGCTPDNSGSATGKASTLTVNPFTDTNTQDLLLITVGQANNTTIFINNPLATTQQNTSSANGIGVFTLPWPSTSTPTVTSINYAGGPFSDDTTLEVTALAPSGTSSTTPFAVNSTNSTMQTGYLHDAGGADFGAAVSAPTFIIPCDSGSLATRTLNTFAVKRNDGTLVPVLSLQCSNGSELIDPGGNATNINTGNGGNTGGANLLFNSGFLDFISRDASAGSQDLNVLTLSTAVAGDSLNATSNNMILGCLLEPCTGGTILGDIILRAQPTKAVRIANGVTDELWVNGSGFVGGVPIVPAATPAAPTVTPTCPNGTCASTWSYAVDCLDANGGTTAVSANGTTSVNAATLDGTHFNTITWTKTIGCKTYELRRTVVATSPATTGIIKTLSSGLALSFVDNNVAGDSSSSPATNTTGTIGNGSVRMGLTLKKGTGSGNYTTASTTYVHVGASELCDTVTIPAGWKLGIEAYAELGTATAAVVASMAISDNASCTTDNAGLLVETTETGTAATVLQSVSLGWAITGDGASHNVALQFKTSNGADSATIANSSATILPTVVYTLMPSN